MIEYLLIFLGITFITLIILYLDSRLSDKPKTTLTYIKTIALTNLICFAVIGFLRWLSPTKNLYDAMQIGGQMGNKIVSSSVKFVPQIGEEMLMGDAPF